MFNTITYMLFHKFLNKMLESELTAETIKYKSFMICKLTYLTLVVWTAYWFRLMKFFQMFINLDIRTVPYPTSLFHELLILQWIEQKKLSLF